MTPLQIMRASRVKNAMLLTLHKREQGKTGWLISELADLCNSDLCYMKHFVQQLVDLDYVRKDSQNLYYYCKIIKSNNIDEVSNLISTSWGTNIYRPARIPRLLSEFTLTELKEELKRRKNAKK